MRLLGVCLPVVLALMPILASPARVAPAPPPPTPIALVDAFPPAPVPGTIADGPAGAPLGVSILGFGRLTLALGATVDLVGPQALVVAAGFPVVTGLAGSAAVGRAPDDNGGAAIEHVPSGGTVRLQPGDWLFLAAGGACTIAGEGGEALVFVTMVTGRPTKR